MPASRTTTKAPIAIPTIGPVPRLDLCDAATGGADVVAAGADDEVNETGVGVIVAPVAVVVRVGASSLGKTVSPGLKASVVFWENKNWLSKLNVEFYILEVSRGCSDLA
jgi:hypothetical protein